MAETNKDIKLSLIIDGNFILNRFAYALNNDNLLYGALYNSLDHYIKKQISLYNFESIYFVSDCKGSWRKQFLQQYKEPRKDKKQKKEIDWEFCYNTYNKFKDDNKNIFKLLESPYIEGDDWISYITSYNNYYGISNLIISNDSDLFQKLNFDINNNWINLMTNQLAFKSALFLPVNYRAFISSISNKSDNLFEMVENDDFIRLIDKLKETNKIEEVNSIEKLFCKIISGDKGDNIPSVYIKNKRGIGAAGAVKICDLFIKEYTTIDFKDPSLFNNMSDIICEAKKLPNTDLKAIEKRIIENYNIISLDYKNFPKGIYNTIRDTFKSTIKSKLLQ